MRRSRFLTPMLLVAGAAMPLAAAQAAPVKLGAALDGANGGDADGTGAFAGTADVAAGKLCYTLTAANTAPPAMAHIHAGAAGKSGPPVVSLKATATEDCVTAEASVLQAIVDHPADYYVNIHTADHPAGAVRGQLSRQLSRK